MLKVNHVAISGNCGKEIRYKAFENTAVGEFSVAVNNSYKGKDGNWVDKTLWMNVKVFSTLADRLSESYQSGKQVYVEGELHDDSYTNKDGVNVPKTVLKATKVQWVEKSQSATNNSGSVQQPNSSNASNGNSMNHAPRPVAQQAATGGDFDELPF